MSDRLPPLTALRAFDAAARHMSFAKAAEELHVTPAALSFQIKSLEDHLGQPVFRRLNRAVELTDTGRALAPGTAEGFAALTSAWRAARRIGDQTHLTVTAGPGFTSLWLAPRLFAFAAAHPEIELRFSASLKLLDFARDDIDVAIRFGQTDDTGLVSRTIFHEWVSPMVTPALAKTLHHPRDLARVPLIEQEDTAFLRPRIDWQAWFDALGLGPAPDPVLRFSQADHAIAAALSGAGAILGRASLSEGALRDGRLVMPFPEALRSSGTYRILCPEGTEARPQVAAFIDWVLDEVAALDDITATRTLLDPPA